MENGRAPFLDVPFIPDEGYTAFLADHLECIYSLHFSLYTSSGLDGRHKGQYHAVSHLLPFLALLPGPGKYVLCNNRFLHPALYSDNKFLADLVSRLQVLLAEDCLQGLIINDYYFLQALADFSPETAACLEAVPGINSLFQSYSHIHNHLLHIEATPFRLPTKIVLDRCLNRRTDLLKNLVQECRQAWPDLICTWNSWPMRDICSTVPSNSVMMPISGLPIQDSSENRPLASTAGWDVSVTYGSNPRESFSHPSYDRKIRPTTWGW